jgi:outer membrane protein OmpA-like peptidoglycan-associated protein
MRRIVRIVEDADYKKWLAEQKSYYAENVKGKEGDPMLSSFSEEAIKARSVEFAANLDKALADTAASALTLTLNNVNFETGSDKLTENSRYELDNLVSAMNKYPKLVVEVGGHTDNVGDAAKNLTLSQARAASVVAYVAKKGIAASRMKPHGFGDTKPVGDNNTEDGKAKNRRTEFTILAH